MSADRELLKNAVLNVVMGAALGALFMASLLVLNVHDISHMLRHSTSPAAVTIILIAGASTYFALPGFTLRSWAEAIKTVGIADLH
jgi:hypothetical protein